MKWFLTKEVCFEYLYVFASLFYLFNFNSVEQVCETYPIQNRIRINSGYKIAIIKYSNAVAMQDYAFNFLCQHE